MTFECTGGLATFDTRTTATKISLRPTLHETAAPINWQIGHRRRTRTTTTRTEMRPSTHGDVVHSRPIAINYGAERSPPKVVVFYSGNDGVLRAVNGNRAPRTTAWRAGNEFWSFIPPEFYRSIKRLRENNVTNNFNGNEDDHTAAAETLRPGWCDHGLHRRRRSPGSTDHAARWTGRLRLQRVRRRPAGVRSLPWKIRACCKVGCPNLTNDLDCRTGFRPHRADLVPGPAP